MEPEKRAPSSDNGRTSAPIELTPVGIIRNAIDKPFLTPGKHGITMDGEFEKVKSDIHKRKQEISTITINQELTGCLDGIEHYSHLTILYWADRVPQESRAVTRVHPMGRKEIPEQGIFSTASPVRPNPILMTVVRLVERDGNVLKVEGLDAVDKSPVIDIKPFTRGFFPGDEVRIPEWMERVMEEVNRDTVS
ncbi:MAG: tRNA (N6-threonylcarbamoyladenosine(37)-N6)-methyltransferase TrmO [Desulfobacteraceae bacterium]|nr:tRNA (N6-threonylcarbamoyladenosine(37)-N6)-methyltransferase TrmO [Desulfobacteraceae bacterium]